MHFQALSILTSLLAVASAYNAPAYSGYDLKWQANFAGAAGSRPNSASWNIMTGGQNFNNEVQKYTNAQANLRLTGGTGSLLIVPLRDSSAPRGWTSARIESKYTFTPPQGKITRVEGALRLGTNSAAHKKGIWPAFWLLGESYRKNVLWPGCGEIDIMENINGEPLGHVALHCDKAPGGRCNEPSGLTTATSISGTGYHTWRVEFNRKSTNYAQQSITWFLDGRQFHKVLGSNIGSAAVWKNVCQSPMFFILNVAIGGDWAGAPNAATFGGANSKLEVGYVAHYVSK